jgi:hypothetical protein
MPKKVYDGGAPEDLTPGVYSQISVDVDKMIDAAEGGVRNGEEKRVEEGKALQIVSRETSDVQPNGSVLPVPLNAKKSWGNKPEPSAYREYFEEYVALGDDRSADKVAEKFDLTHWQMNKICTEWCWVERIELIEHERALIQSIVRQDDVTAALQAVSIGMARELLQRVKVDEKTGMITGIKDLQFETKRDLERCVDMVLLIREKVFSDEQVANKPRGAGRLPAGGMGGRPVINFIIRK